MAKTPITKTTKSGGPQTEGGKKIASRNALKTGAYSNTLILPGEDEAQFLQIEEQFIHDFDPRDMAEIAMVRDLAVLAWKKNRLENLEWRFTVNKLKARTLNFFEEQEVDLLQNSRVQAHLDRLPSYTDSYYKQVNESLEQAKKLTLRGMTLEDLKRLENQFRLLFEILSAEIKEIDNDFEIDSPHDPRILESLITDANGEAHPFIPHFLARAIDQLEEISWVIYNREAIVAQLQIVQDMRLKTLMENDKPSRAFDDLRRNFYRTLTELRKHQEWRRKMQAIDRADEVKTIE